MNLAFDSLNAQSLPANITLADLTHYIDINSVDADNALSRSELLSAVEPILFDLVLEYAVRSNDPYTVYE